MEYLSGEWLVESWYMKEHRYKWYLCATNFKKNVERAVVPITLISYEWNVQVSLDTFSCWKYSWHYGVGEQAGGCCIFTSLCFPLKLKILQYEKSSAKVSWLDYTALLVCLNRICQGSWVWDHVLPATTEWVSSFLGLQYQICGSLILVPRSINSV